MLGRDFLNGALEGEAVQRKRPSPWERCSDLRLIVGCPEAVKSGIRCSIVGCARYEGRFHAMPSGRANGDPKIVDEVADPSPGHWRSHPKAGESFLSRHADR